MRKYLSICTVLITAVVLSGCSGDTTSKRLVGTYAGSEVAHAQGSLTTAQEVAFTKQLLSAAIVALDNITNMTHPSTNVWNYSVAHTYSSSAGGSMYLSGTCNALYNTSTSLYGWTMSINDTVTNFAFVYNNVTYTMNGSNISLTSNNALNTTSSIVIENPSSVSISGTYFISGGGVSSQSIYVNVSVAITPNTTPTSGGGTMTGTVGGITVNQAFTL